MKPESTAAHVNTMFRRKLIKITEHSKLHNKENQAVSCTPIRASSSNSKRINLSIKCVLPRDSDSFMLTARLHGDQVVISCLIFVDANTTYGEKGFLSFRGNW